MIEQLPLETLGLGTPLREFAVGRGRRLWLTILSLAATGLAVWFVAGLLFLVQVGPGQQGEALLFDALFGLPVAGCVVLLWRNLHGTYSLRAVLYPSGLLLQRHGKSTVLRWEQIEAVRVRSRRKDGLLPHLLLHSFALLFLLRRLQPAQRYSIRLTTGTTVTIPTEVTDAATLGRLVEAEATRCLLPQARATYAIGGTLAFGALTLSRDGLCKGRKVLSLGDLGRIERRNGELRVFRVGRRRRWAAIPTGKLPNLALLQALLAELPAAR